MRTKSYSKSGPHKRSQPKPKTQTHASDETIQSAVSREEDSEACWTTRAAALAASSKAIAASRQWRGLMISPNPWRSRVRLLSLSDGCDTFTCLAIAFTVEQTAR